MNHDLESGALLKPLLFSLPANALSSPFGSHDRVTLLAGDDYWDGRTWNRRGRNTYLLASSHGHYFLHTRSSWPGEADGETQMISHEEARCIYENLPNKRMTREAAFDVWKNAGPVALKAG